MGKEEMITNARVLKEFSGPELGELKRGKVRDNYISGENMIMVATDRISSFDFVLSRQIPFKGQILTEIMWEQLQAVSDIMSHNAFAKPDPQVLVVKDMKPYDVEIVIRGYITGSLWRDYEKLGPEEAGRQYGITLPAGLKMNQKFNEPIVTPTTKAPAEPESKKPHHDLPVSRTEIISKVLLRNIDGVGKKREPNPFYIKESEYDTLVDRCVLVFNRGQQIASAKGLIIVDTKYEVNELGLADEVHTPDSSRYWYKKTYQKAFENGEKQRALDKEFVRDWLRDNGYDPAIGEKSLPDLTKEMIVKTALRYIELYETLLGREFVPGDMQRPLEERIMYNLKRNGFTR